MLLRLRRPFPIHLVQRMGIREHIIDLTGNRSESPVSKKGKGNFVAIFIFTRVLGGGERLTPVRDCEDQVKDQKCP